MSAAARCLLLQNHAYDFPSQGERENKKHIALFITQLSIFGSLYPCACICVDIYIKAHLVTNFYF